MAIAMSFSAVYSQNVGVGNNLPLSKLDVSGDIALREGTAISVAAGANTITLPAAKSSVYRLTGATGAFSISSISAGNDGMLLTLINATGQVMTITNGTIQTNTGANLVGSGTVSTINLLYNATLTKWLVASAEGFIQPSNNIYNADGTLTGARTMTMAGNALNLNGGTLTTNQDATVHTLTVGLGGSSVINNTAVGSGALSANTSGIQNTALGFDALNVNTTGGANTAIGLRALNLNTSGNNNTATGIFTLEDNTIGSANTAYGVAAMSVNTTGNYNTATGFRALNVNTSGNNNTGNGYYSLSGTSSGSNNLADGDSSGMTNTTGSNNTYLGYFSNSSSGTFNNATAVGANSYVGASNSLVLGSINGVNGATASTNVGLGTSTPVSALDVLTISGQDNSAVANFLNSANTAAGSQTDIRVGASRSNSNATELRFTVGTGGNPNFAQIGLYGFVTGPAITSAGNVGIGTTAPAYPLDVVGNTRTTNFEMTSGAAAGNILQSDASGNATWVTPASIAATNIYNTNGTLTGARTVTMAGNNLNFTGGNVGIGTVPAAPLHVYSSSSTGLLVDGPGNLSMALATAGVIKAAFGTGSAGAFSPEAAAGDLIIRTTTGRILLNTSNGVSNAAMAVSGNNVGIATSTPAYPLDVNGVVNTATGYKVAGGTPSTSTYLKGNGANFVAGSILAADVPTLPYVDLTTAQTAAGIKTWSSAANFSGGAVNMTNTTSNMITYPLNGGVAIPSFTASSVGTKLLLYPQVNASNVDYAIGIATNSAWYSVPQASSTYYHAFYGGTTELMRIRGDGRVGIGVTAPVLALDVVGNTQQVAEFYNPSATANGTYTIINVGTSSSSNNAAQYRFLAGATNALNVAQIGMYGFATGPAINSAGSVGIGTTAPAYPLDVTGVVNASTGFKVAGGTPSTSTYLKGNGTNFAAGSILAADLPSLSGSYVDLTTAQTAAGIKTWSSNALFAGTINMNATGNTTSNTNAGVEWNYGATDRYGISQTNGGGMSMYTSTAFATSFLNFGLSGTGGATVLGTEFMRITHAGLVGIGTIAPASMLDVNGGLRVAANQTTHAQGVNIEWNKDGSSGISYILNQKGAGSGGLYFGEVDVNNNMTPRMFINGSGSVGINNTAPAATLDVTGTLNVSSTANIAAWASQSIGTTASPNGYARMGGLLIQWGILAYTTGAGLSVTFPTGFTNLLSITATVDAGANTGAGANDPCKVMNPTLTTFQIGGQAGHSADAVTKVRWMAIGN